MLFRSYPFQGDLRITDFTEYAINVSWNILNNQGYEMSNKMTVYNALWLQSYEKHSYMERHIHSDQSQIIGLYVLDAPENCNRLLIHDPRPGKVQINMEEKNMEDLTYASTMVNFQIEPGMFYFFNSSVLHSFTPNGSDQPCNFIHFNVGVKSYFKPENSDNPSLVEVI